MIYFVGVHYKKGYTALDSRTISGKIIDRIIEGVGKDRCEKMNLYPTEYLPSVDFQKEYIQKFINSIDNNSLYILLGKEVWIVREHIHNSFLFYHPSYYNRNGTKKVNDFVCEAIKIINDFLS